MLVVAAARLSGCVIAGSGVTLIMGEDAKVCEECANELRRGASKQVWVESTSVTDSVRNFQGIMNRGSSAGKVYWDLPPSNRKERKNPSQI